MQTTMKRALSTLLGTSCLLLAVNTPAAQETERDYDAELTELVQNFENARDDWIKTLRAAETDEERQALMDEQPGEEFVLQFQELADDAAGTEAAGGAWMWVLKVTQNGHEELKRQAVEILLNDYIDSDVIEELPLGLRHGGSVYGEELCVSGLRTMVTESSNAKVAAGAHFQLAGYLLDLPNAGEEQMEEARELLEALKEKYGELQDGRKRTYAALADGVLQSMEIAPGKPAPEIEGKDLDGVPFKLSDYRGKVVLLDFWGHW
jgi:hypothetical protein